MAKILITVACLALRESELCWNYSQYQERANEGIHLPPGENHFSGKLSLSRARCVPGILLKWRFSGTRTHRGAECGRSSNTTCVVVRCLPLPFSSVSCFRFPPLLSLTLSDRKWVPGLLANQLHLLRCRYACPDLKQQSVLFPIETCRVSLVSYLLCLLVIIVALSSINYLLFKIQIKFTFQSIASFPNEPHLLSFPVT